MSTSTYDPFARGPLPVGVRTIEAHDPARDRSFPIEMWYPADRDGPEGQADPGEERDAAARAGLHPLIVYSHGSGLHRRSASFLCTHLAGHGYVVAAIDHSEVSAPELAPREGETDAERMARIEGIIAGRVPDVRFLLDRLLRGGVAGIELDPLRVGLVGYSFGGWTVLATAEVETRVRSVVAMGPGGGSNPRPGILPVTLSLAWGCDIPTIYLAAENDVLIPLDGVIELFGRTPGPKRLFILHRADHQHFLDGVEEMHEGLRAMPLPGDSAWIPAAMRPISELASGEQAHLFTRGLTLAHLDSTLRNSEAAERFLAGDVEAALAARGVEAVAYHP
jgi:predicted dienelactone hydrolase